jgi:hypothetical protein
MDMGPAEMAVTEGAEHTRAPGRRAARESLDEQARRKGVRPLQSVDELRDDEIWESDEELAEFLAYLDAARQSWLDGLHQPRMKG